MSAKALWTLRSDPEFLRLAMPLPEPERNALEEDILSDRRREPVAVWRRTIIEGYDRYRIYKHYAITFALEEKIFPSEADAMLWACERQISRRHISTAARRYLLGTIYLVSKSKHPEVKRMELFRQIGDKFGVSPITVRDSRVFANKLDFLRQKEPELTEGILSGKYSVNPHTFTGLAHKSSQELRALVHASNMTELPDPFPPVHTVKDMPNFDPDGPLMSLALTIPSWIRIIEQAPVNPGYSTASPECRQKLEQALFSLYETTEKTLQGIWEG